MKESTSSGAVRFAVGLIGIVMFTWGIIGMLEKYERDDNNPDTGTYRTPGGLRVAVDGVDKGPAPSDEHGTEMFGPPMSDVPQMWLWDERGPGRPGPSLTKFPPGGERAGTEWWCHNGVFRVEWEGHQPMVDRDTCVWRCGP